MTPSGCRRASVIVLGNETVLETSGLRPHDAANGIRQRQREGDQPSDGCPAEREVGDEDSVARHSHRAGDVAGSWRSGRAGGTASIFCFSTPSRRHRPRFCQYARMCPGLQHQESNISHCPHGDKHPLCSVEEAVRRPRRRPNASPGRYCLQRPAAPPMRRTSGGCRASSRARDRSDGKRP
jgi:hypothetical protein